MKSQLRKPFSVLWISFIGILLNVALSKSQEPPRLITPYQKNYIVFVNKMVNLTCPYKESFFRWESDNFGSHIPRTVSSAKYLIFKALSTKASGVYNCFAINGFGRHKTSLYLKIIDPEDSATNKDCVGAVTAEIPAKGMCFLEHTPEEYQIVEVEDDQEATLYCRTVQKVGTLTYSWQLPPGVPPPEVNGRPLISQEKLTVYGKPGNEGRYVCQVHGARGSLKRIFQVIIKAPIKNKQRLIKGPRISNLTVAFGGRAVLRCEAIKRLRMRWGKIVDPQLKDVYGEEVLEWEEGNRVVMQGSTTEFEGTGTEIVRQLVFDPVKTSDAGQYVCKAIGSNVEDDKFVQLFVRPKPSNFVNRNIMVLYIGIPLVVIIACCIFIYCIINQRRKIRERQLNGLPHHHESSGPMQPMLSGNSVNGTSGYHPTNMAYMQQQPSLHSQQTAPPNSLAPNSKAGLIGPSYKSQYMVDPYPMPPGSHPGIAYASSDATSPSPLYYSGGVNASSGVQYPTNGYSSQHYPG